MNKRTILLLLVLAIMLSGCMYSEEVKREGAPASGEYITVVQHAVDQFQKLTGVLPIKNKEMNTPIYEKYPIDFNKLKDRRLISVIPTNAFENGGTAIYVIVHPETKPEVKLMDLVSYQRLSAIQKSVDTYRDKHDGQIPKGDQAYPGWYWLDAGKLSEKPEPIISPYSRRTLNAVVSDSGQVAIDYAPDIVQLLSKSGGKPADPNVDLRELLVASGFYVPACSSAYKWSDNQPLMLLP